MTRKIKFKLWKDPVYSDSDLEEEGRAPMILTPHGPVSLKLHGELKNNLKFFVGHTNFDIGEAEKLIIENTPGINILDVFSPYTFKFNVGELFPPRSVMKNLRQRLCGKEQLMLSKEKVFSVYQKQLELKSNGNLYGVYVAPNGGFDFFETKSKEEYKEKITSYYEVQKELGGEVLYG